MSQSRTIYIATVLLFGGIAFAAHAYAANEDRQQPNIIYLMLDDAGYGDFGAFGSPYVKTPNFDRLCAEGMTFTNHYSGSAVCAPTRCVLMTGLHTGHCRRRDNTAKALTQELSEKNGRPLVFLEDAPDISLLALASGALAILVRPVFLKSKDSTIGTAILTRCTPMTTSQMRFGMVEGW